MSTMRLQPVGMSEADVTRLEVFLRFIGQSARGQWVLVRDGAADLLICAAGARRFVPPDPASEVAVLSEQGKPQDARTRDIALPGILDLEAFQELLATVESRMSGAAASPAAAPRPPSPAAQPACQRSAITTLAGRFRLIRWPAAQMLRSHPKAVRLLGFLSREAISVEQLETLSGVDRAACIEILQELLRRDLLAWHGPPAIASPPVTRPASQPASATGDPGGPLAMPSGQASAAGLLSRLRATLGLS